MKNNLSTKCLALLIILSFLAPNQVLSQTRKATSAFSRNLASKSEKTEQSEKILPFEEYIKDEEKSSIDPLKNLLDLSRIPKKTGKSETITIVYTFDEPTFIPLENGYNKISMPATQIQSEEGKPEIPIRYAKVLLPFATKLDSYTITLGERVTLSSEHKLSYGEKQLPILPEQKLIDAGFDVSSAMPNEMIYLSKNKYPERTYTNPAKQVDRGFVFYTFNLCPIEYIPENGKISYYKTITITLKPKAAPIEHGYRGKQTDREIILDKFLSDITANTNEQNAKKENSKIVDKSTALENLPKNQREIKSYILDSYPIDRNPMDPSREECQYLIITDENLALSFQVFADYKESRLTNPISACVVTVEDIYDDSDYSCTGPYNWGDTCGSFNQFNDKAAKIRNYIRYAYQELSTEYVLLGGDADKSLAGGQTELPIVPVRYLGTCPAAFGQTEIPSDLYYSNLDGGFDSNNNNSFMEIDDINIYIDLFSDVFVGRAPVDSITEADNFVQKTILAQPNNERLDPLMLGEYAGLYYGIYKYAIAEIEEIKFGSIPSGTSGFIEAYYPEEVDMLCDTPPAGSPNSPPEYQWNMDEVMTRINEGAFYINHTGHATNTMVMKMSLDDVSDLDNQRPIFIYSHGCYSGAFDNENPYTTTLNTDSISEKLLTSSPITGAFATVMNSRFGWFSAYSTNGASQTFGRWFWDGAFNNVSGPAEKSLGRLNSYSHEKNNGLISSAMDECYRYVYLTTNLLGDPEYRFNFSEFNSRPILSPIGNKGCMAENTIEFALSATDPNSEDILIFSANDLPEGATFNTETQIFSWTPNFNQTGDHSITFNVSDNGTPILEDSESMIITVKLVNDPPYFDTLTGFKHMTTLANIGSYVFDVEALDDGIYQDLTYFFESGNEEEFFAIDSSTGAITTNKALETGSYDLLVNVFDGELNAENKKLVEVCVTLAFRISGFILKNGQPLKYVSVIATSPNYSRQFHATTNNQGYYSFDLPGNSTWSTTWTVTPNFEDYIFDPESAILQANPENVIQNFSAYDSSQFFELKEGWNLISFNIVCDDMSLANILNPIINQVEIIKDDHIGVIWPDYNIDTIGEMNINEGYQIKMNSNVNFSIAGNQAPLDPNETILTLNEGWNIIGFPLINEIDAAAIFQPLIDSDVFVQAVDEDNNSLSLVNGQSINEIGSLKPGKGYHVKVTSSCNLPLQAYMVSGTITNNYFAIPGISLSATGGTGEVFLSGTFYAYLAYPGSNITLTPQAPGHTFEPSILNISNIQNDIQQNFIGTSTDQ